MKRSPRNNREAEKRPRAPRAKCEVKPGRMILEAHASGFLDGSKGADPQRQRGTLLENTAYRQGYTQGEERRNRK